ncbi:hypothetical protein T265_06398 [Opisthorchis viverrini]|uniref:Uncharacterized protein n=1 Tax=Opisthorchis viverrini TaxID=6198 RepID=A0A074ZGL7_OPIVI|nr:hypothetical protein T265_06398 [Opisthorchis viverrini]KER26353.1 hypothetical protein T265_06398 [Opisthorchis viverrini]
MKHPVRILNVATERRPCLEASDLKLRFDPELQELIRNDTSCALIICNIDNTRCHHRAVIGITVTLFSFVDKIAQWMEREFTNRKVCGSNPTSASRIPLSRPGQPGSIPALRVA